MPPARSENGTSPDSTTRRDHTDSRFIGGLDSGHGRLDWGSGLRRQQVSPSHSATCRVDTARIIPAKTLRPRFFNRVREIVGRPGCAMRKSPRGSASVRIPY